MRTMRALVKERRAPGAAIREVPVPEPGPGEVLIQVQAASVCGTDVHIERWDAWAQANVQPPLVFGHEMAGIVVARGEGATRVPMGSLVAAETHLVDWTCYQCRTGRANVCQHLRILGVQAPGVFAEYAVIPETNAWVSEGLAPEVAALQEPMGNAVHALFVEEIAGQSVAILGCGPIGLMAVAIARMAGARHVFATDLNPERLAVAGRMGAHEAIDAHEDVVARLRAATDGDGVDPPSNRTAPGIPARKIQRMFSASTNVIFTVYSLILCAPIPWSICVWPTNQVAAYRANALFCTLTIISLSKKSESPTAMIRVVP